MDWLSDILNDNVSAAQVAQNTQSGAYGSFGTTASGSWQSALLGIGTNYLNGLATIDLQGRAYANVPQITSRQYPLNTDLTTQGVSALGSMRLGNLLPFLLLGVGAYVLLSRN